MIAREDLLIPCTGEPMDDIMVDRAASTQAVARWRFPGGLGEGTYELVLFDTALSDGRKDDQTWIPRTVIVASQPADDADGADGGEEPPVVPRPDRVDTGAGGSAGVVVPGAVLLLLAIGAALTAAALVERRS